MRVKPGHPWVADPNPGRGVSCAGVEMPLRIDANTWFLARQRAAIVMRCEPGDLDVRPCLAAPVGP